VIINHGTNDDGQHASDDVVAAALADALDTLIDVVPSRTRFFVLRPFGGYKEAALRAGVARCRAPFRISWVDTTGWWSPVDSADTLHPYGYATLQIATKLSVAMRSVLAGSNTLVKMPDGTLVPT
jgi:hypothetical protein